MARKQEKTYEVDIRLRGSSKRLDNIPGSPWTLPKYEWHLWQVTDTEALERDLLAVLGDNGTSWLRHYTGNAVVFLGIEEVLNDDSPVIARVGEIVQAHQR